MENESGSLIVWFIYLQYIYNILNTYFFLFETMYYQLHNFTYFFSIYLIRFLTFLCLAQHKKSWRMIEVKCRSTIIIIFLVFD